MSKPAVQRKPQRVPTPDERLSVARNAFLRVVKWRSRGDTQPFLHPGHIRTILGEDEGRAFEVLVEQLVDALWSNTMPEKGASEGA